MQFGVLRFIAGLGIGGVMLNVVSLMSEYSPKRSRSTLVALMFSGYAVGGMLSAGLGIWIVPTYGWQVMFFLAIVPMLAVPLIIRSLPDSVGFLLAQGKTDTVRTVMRQVAPQLMIQDQDSFSVTASPSRKAAMAELFSQGRAMSTAMFWLAFFCCLLMVYALGSWLPKLMSLAGYPLSSSLLFLMILNVGAIVGAIGGGWLSDRFSLKSVLVTFFLFGSIALVLLGYKNPMWVLYTMVAIAGATTIGSQIILYAYVAQYYPAHVRSTGLGWASGIGRNGAILGPIIGGALLAMELPHQVNFLSLAIPGAIATLAVSLIGMGTRASAVRQADEASTAAEAAN